MIPDSTSRETLNSKVHEGRKKDFPAKHIFSMKFTTFVAFIAHFANKRKIILFSGFLYLGDLIRSIARSVEIKKKRLIIN